MAFQQAQQISTASWNDWIANWQETLFNTTQGNAVLLESQCSIACDDIKQCAAFRRVLYIMQFYQQFQQRPNSIRAIFECFNNSQTQNFYNLVNLFNDHQHLLQFHRLADHDDDYEYIFEQLSQYYPCDIHKCCIMARHGQSAPNPFWKTFANDLNAITLIKLLDKMHCSLYHTFDLFRFTKQETAAIEQFAVEQNKLDEQDLLNRSYYLHLNNLMKEKYENFQLLSGQHTKTNKYCTVMVAKKYSDLSQDDEKKLYDSDGEEIESASNGNRQKSAFECLGFRYFYDEQSRHKSETQNATLVKKKWSNLQREMCNNAFVTLSVHEWNEQLNLAQIYLYSMKGRLISSRSTQSLDVECIVSLMLYCNVEALQSAFMQSYLLLSKQDNYQLAADRHREFVNWAIILNRSINNFGNRVNDQLSTANDSRYYHALIEQDEQNPLSFNESYLRFYCPLLLSQRIEVLQQYTRCINHNTKETNGMILGLSAAQSGGGLHKYFDCVWLSSFENEESVLFMHNIQYIERASVLRIGDMIDIRKHSNFGAYMGGISILHHIINNEIISFATDKCMFAALGKLISHRLRPIAYDSSNKEEAFIDAIFASFCQLQTGIITIDMNKLSSLCNHKDQNASSFLRNYLISATPHKKDVFVLKCHNLVELFANTPSMEIQHCCLNAIMFELICQSLKLQENRIRLESIEFSSINEEESELTPQAVVNAYTVNMEEIGWSIEYDEDLQLLRLQQLQFILLSPKSEITVSIFNSAFYFGNTQKSTEIDGHNNEVKTSHGVYQIKVVHHASTAAKRKRESKTWMVDKRYSDLLKLHKWFTKKRSGIKSIAISKEVRFPSKTLFRKPNTSTVMDERRDKFEKYLQFLLLAACKHPNKIFLKKLSYFLSPTHQQHNDVLNDI